ncbi:MAG: N-6 DNA methylase [Candidatus Atribacteria bacterium]|nr:N-6 DNA methylase [Candidatus Atribacteria bacterium]
MKETYKTFLLNLKFDLDNDIQLKELSFQNHALSTRLKNNTYFYQPPANSTKTSFYFFDSPNITQQEQDDIHSRIWNENKADLYFIPENSNIKLFFTKTNPKKDRICLGKFPVHEEDERLLKKISKQHFDSGAIWLGFQRKLKKIKQSTVDYELVRTLKNLRKLLEDAYKEIIFNKTQQNDTIQALIDRTLFIKFLEDRKIINSYFYQHFFKGEDFKYFLKNYEKRNINLLFRKINHIFNIVLFEKPEIPEEHLTDTILGLLYDTISHTDLSTGQLSLFDFQFDIIPVEFISHIYQIFLEEKQPSEGIHYTPEGLAKLIVDSVMKEMSGTVLDPSCGSGMFLVLAFRNLLKIKEIRANNTLELIKLRNKLLVENIFGIEKNPIARRLAIFSLYLELLQNIESKYVNEFIKDEITKSSQNLNIFPYKFDNNIQLGNALETKDDLKPFKEKKFDFIVGNPPWKEIKEDDEELNYWKLHQDKIDGKQLSQCFLIKINDWGKKNTRLGFVVNSSNFHNEFKNFQPYFFDRFKIEQFYELSNIKDFLFLDSKEPASVVIFTNEDAGDNVIQYLSPQGNEFSKIFKVILLKDENRISIAQKDLIRQSVQFRDYLLGDEKDVELVNKIENPNNKKLKDYVICNEKDLPYIHEGLTFVSSEAVRKEFGISKAEWASYSKQKQDDLKEEFRNKYSRKVKTEVFNIPHIKPGNIAKYKILSHDCYMGEDISAFERTRKKEIFLGDKVLFCRVSADSKAVYCSKKIYFSSDIWVLKLKNPDLYYSIQAILNSKLINYFLSIKARKREGSSYPKVNQSDIGKIPIPGFLDSNSLREINILSEKLIKGNDEYELNIEEKINDLVFDLYDLTIIERNRINDFYLKDNIVAKKENIIEYCNTFFKVIKNYLQDNVRTSFEYFIEESLPISFAGMKISLSKSDEDSRSMSPSIEKVSHYLITEIIENAGNTNILSLRERIYGEHCIYFLKDKYLKSWTKTKAVGDAQKEIERLCR